MYQYKLVHGSHLEQRIFVGTKWLGRYQVQASRFMAQVIVLVIINAMISNDWKIGIMEESKKSQYKYCLIVKNREILKGSGVNVSWIIIHWKPYATYNNKKVPHNHMIIKLINISYITKFYYINWFCIMDSNCYI